MMIVILLGIEMDTTTQSPDADDVSSSADEADVKNAETNTGLDENVAAALSYVFGWVTGIVMFLVESDNEHVRFHAAQSIVVFGGLMVLSIVVGFFSTGLAFMTGGGIVSTLISMIIGLVSFVIWIAVLVLWVYLIARTYQGKDPRVPVAAGIAEDFV